MTEILFRGRRMNLRTFGDAFSTAPYIVKYHDINRERFIDRLTSRTFAFFCGLKIF